MSEKTKEYSIWTSEITFDWAVPSVKGQPRPNSIHSPDISITNIKDLHSRNCDEHWFEGFLIEKKYLTSLPNETFSDYLNRAFSSDGENQTFDYPFFLAQNIKIEENDDYQVHLCHFKNEDIHAEKRLKEAKKLICYTCLKLFDPKDLDSKSFQDNENGEFIILECKSCYGDGFSEM